MKQLTQNWLTVLCKLIQGVDRAAVFMNAPGTEGYTPVAFWPEYRTDYQDFVPSAKAALSKGRGILLADKSTGEDSGEPLDTIACPLVLNKQMCGVVVINMSNRVPVHQQAAIRQAEAAAVWFETILNQRTSAEKTQLVTIVELVASCLEHERFQAAATDVATDFATRLSCDRVSIGFLNGHTVEIEAISHSAGFDSRSSLVSGVAEAMHEAIDQNSTIIYPQTADDVLLTRCHASLVEEHGIGTILTVPIVVNGHISGAVLVERPPNQPFDQTTIEHFEQIVSMVGPILAVRRRDEQWLPQRIRNSLRDSLVKLFGPGHIALKVGFASMVFCLVVLSFVNGDYRVTGGARLEAQTQRVVVAPQEGYIAEANVRPGDIIQSGDLLGTLDDKDLTLEQRKWSSQLGQLQTEYRDALSSHNRSKVSIIRARILQAEAQLNLVNEKLSRTRFAAPFDGLIVSGDLSQALGSPVERGQVLFTVAPLNAYRVILEVDERDIGNVREAQLGTLVLSGMPGKRFPFTVEKITPVSTAEEGRNFFKVEAKIEEHSDLLRPGMEGVAKINIERRKLIWIWTHKLVDWLRLTLWSVF